MIHNTQTNIRFGDNDPERFRLSVPGLFRFPNNDTGPFRASKTNTGPFPVSNNSLLNILSFLLQQLQGGGIDQPKGPPVHIDPPTHGRPETSNSMREGNDVVINDSQGRTARFSLDQIPRLLEEFRASGHPDIGTIGIENTDWGFLGSSAELRAFEKYLLDITPQTADTNYFDSAAPLGPPGIGLPIPNFPRSPAGY